MKKLFKFIALITCATILAARPLPVYGPIDIGMLTSDWNIMYSKGTGKMYQYNSGWGYNFPGPNGKVGYIVQDTYGYIPVSTSTTKFFLEAVGEIVASPDAVFDYLLDPSNTGSIPASTRFYVEYHWSDELYVRWWATGANCIVLANGKFQYTVEIDPSQWSDAYGQRGDSSPEALAGFYQSFAHVQRFGFTDGGGRSYGHGIRMKSGKASFNVDTIRFKSAPVQ
jgi:hypothetical protein